jgi:hypothetical protein
MGGWDMTYNTQILVAAELYGTIARVTEIGSEFGNVVAVPEFPEFSYCPRPAPVSECQMKVQRGRMPRGSNRERANVQEYPACL